jgi:hypothetical protein
MIRFLIGLLLFFSAITSSAQNTTTTYYNLSDDGWAQVNLPFSFPFYNRSFTTSFFFSNGVVGFLNPTHGWCCDGQNLNNVGSNSAFNFAIMPLWVDLIGDSQTKFFTQTDSTFMRYTWQNTKEYGTNNRNTFNVEIRPTGAITINYNQVNVTNHNVTVGISGNISQGQYSQIYNGRGLTTSGIPSTISFTGTETYACTSNPLSDPSCPDYATAYLTQQCTISALYNSACPGYASAYYSQQCTISALYDSGCPGYSIAYYNLQCSLNPLYDSGCPGYTTAYHNQQCSLNALFATDCPDYATAYHNQQCSLNALFATDCPGYATTYHNQQCSLNALFATDCPGYAAAYYSQQCNLNGLYDRNCPNYSDAYARKMLFENQGIASTIATAGVIAATAPKAQEITTQTTTSTPKLVSDNNVNSVITNNSNAAAPSASPANVVSSVPLVQQQPPQGAPQPGPAPQQKQTGGPASGSSPSPQGSAPDQGPKPMTRGEQLQQAKMNAARKEAASKGGDAMKETAGAKTLEQQVANQNTIITAMGFNMAFDAYSNIVLKDVVFYRSVDVYSNQRNVDNARLLRGMYGASDRRFEEMKDLQYK